MTEKKAWEPPTWPENMRIPVIGLTGHHGSGKSSFGLLIDPEHTFVYDSELSSETYASQLAGLDRVSIPGELVQRFGSKGYRPIDVYLWWRDHMRRIEPGRYRVIILDVATDVEAGLLDWVRKNPAHFNKSPGQYAKMSGLVQGDAKSQMKIHIAELAERCDVFIFTTHLGKVWENGAPTTQDKPKGSGVFMEMASIYFKLERPKDKKGVQPDVPSGFRLKGRVSRFFRVGGKLRLVECIPPRMPECSYESMCEYIIQPPDPAKLRAEERAPDKGPSKDELMHKEAAIAFARKEAAELELELETIRQQRENRSSTEADPTPEPAPEVSTPTHHPATSTAGVAPPAPSATPGPAPSRVIVGRPQGKEEEEAEAPPATEASRPDKEQLCALVKLREEWWASVYRHDTQEDRETAWRVLLDRVFGVARAGDLDLEKFAVLCDKLEEERDAAAAKRESETMQGEPPPF